MKLTLPPKIKERVNKSRRPKWDSLAVDVNFLGELLAYHLIVEHYMTRYIEANSPRQFDWDAARASFVQKLRLISGDGSRIRAFGFLECIEQLNKLRNRKAHRIDATIEEEDVAIFRESLDKFDQAMGIKSKNTENMTSPIQTIGVFTWVFCSYVAGYLTAISD